MAKLLIPDVYDKIATVLDEMKWACGETAKFTADEFVDEYEMKYPGDKSVMDERRKIKPRAHSLRGYLDGILTEFCEKQSQGNGAGTSIRWLASKSYRFVK